MDDIKTGACSAQSVAASGEHSEHSHSETVSKDERSKRANTDDDIKVTKPILSDWMATTDGVKALTIAQTVWPGTHDSGSYSAATIDYATPASTFTRQAFWTEYVRSGFKSPAVPGMTPAEVVQFLENITTNHGGAPIYTQLMDGARFLDIRVARSYDTSDTTYYVVHEFVVSKLDDILRDIARFLDEHRGEVVMMRLQPRDNIKTAKKAVQALLDYIDQFSGTVSGKPIRDYAYPKTDKSEDFSQCGTIGNLVELNRRLLLVVDSEVLQESINWFYWSQAAHWDSWKAEHTTVKKEEQLLQDLKRASQSPKGNKVYNLQFILTPPGQNALWDQTTEEAALNGILQNRGNPSLPQLANMINPTLHQFVFSSMSSEEREFMTIFTADRYHEYRNEFYAVVRDVLYQRNKK